MEKKGNGGLIAIIIILVIALLGLSLYVAYDKGLIFNNEESNEVEEKDKTEEDENTSNIETESNYVSLEIKDENCINNRGMSYGVRGYDSTITIEVNDDNTVSIRYVHLSSAWGIQNVENDQLFVQIPKFSKKITDVMISGIGQDISSSTAIFLMEDGTLEYIPLYKALHANSIKSYGTLEGVTGVIKLYGVTAIPTDSPIGGHYTILAQKADGTYYDLNSILKATGNY